VASNYRKREGSFGMVKRLMLWELGSGKGSLLPGYMTMIALGLNSFAIGFMYGTPKDFGSPVDVIRRLCWIAQIFLLLVPYRGSKILCNQRLFTSILAWLAFSLPLYALQQILPVRWNEYRIQRMIGYTAWLSGLALSHFVQSRNANPRNNWRSVVPDIYLLLSLEIWVILSD
jgi:hypothetical protein